MLLNPETAAEAQARVVGNLIDEIGLLAALAAPQQLLPGHYIRVAGEWARVVSVAPDDELRLSRLDCTCQWSYRPSVGERFVWDMGAF